MPPKRAAPLPAKERGLFARLLTEYETKKHRLALKTADAILKRVPEHGETLAVKGLILFTLHERAEGVRLAKLGVRYDLGSFICWHVLGIIYRMARDYVESLKCYTQALRIEGGNINILRETGFLQLQLRNYAPLIDVRLTLLQVQPHLRANWIALAVAHALAGNRSQAARVLAAYEDVTRDVPPRNYEFSEVVLFHAALLIDDCRGDEALALLDKQGARIVDEPAALGLRARALARTDPAASRACWHALVERNPENGEHVEALLAGEADPLATLEALQATFPRAAAIRRMALTHASGAAFERHAAAYLEHALVRNIPSLFSDIKALYVDAAKRAAIEAIAERLRIAWAPPAGAPPTAYLWTLYFLAQHYSSVGSGERALQYIDSAIAHTPTLPELHMTRARILKRLGARAAAADAMDDARLLDGQDRYLNTKAAKYALRVDDVARATATVKLFTRPEVADPLVDLVEMQAVNYVLEDGRAHARRGELALALKRFVQVVDTTQEIYDDQLDFHGYCMRKMTLRAYIGSVHMEDRIFERRACVEAAQEAVATYLALHDRAQAEAAAPAAAPAAPAAAPPGAEDRKAAQKARKAEARAAEAASSVPAVAPAAAPASDDPPAPADPDPHGEELAARATLADTHRFVRMLQDAAPDDVRTWLLAFDVAVREHKWHLVLRALVQAMRIAPADGRVHERVLRAHGALPDGVPVDAVADLVPALRLSPSAAQAEYMQRHTGAAAALGGARGACALGDVDGAVALVEGVGASGSLAEVEAGLALLRAHGAPTDAYVRACASRLPRADAFAAPDALAAAAATRAAARAHWLSHV